MTAPENVSVSVEDRLSTGMLPSAMVFPFSSRAWILTFHPPISEEERFLISAAAEFMYLYCQRVLAVCQIICDVKFVGAEHILAVPRLSAVDIHIVCGLNTLEMDINPVIVRPHARISSLTVNVFLYNPTGL